MRGRPVHWVLVVVVAWGAGCAGPRSPKWHDAGEYRWAELDVPRRGDDGFTRLEPRRTAITFTNAVTETQVLQNEFVLNGSGVALGDVDGDGLPDVFLSGLDVPNALYRNLGDFRFEDITERAGVAAPDRLSTGAVFVDVDGDDDLDLLLTSLGGPHGLFLNDGTGVFTDATATSGFIQGHYGTTQTLADVDGDGDLDLYVANNKERTVRDIHPPDSIAFDRVVRAEGDSFAVSERFREHYALRRSGNVLMRLELAEPDRLYLNDGTGRFELVPFTRGRFLDEHGRPLAAAPRDWGLSARFFDFDGDGDPDLYVCNDFESPDHIWLNDGTGHFRALPLDALRTTSNANMAIDFSDVDRDGDVDMLAVDMLDLNTGKQKTQTPASVVLLPTVGEPTERQQLPRNTLLVNRGDGTFAEAALYAGVAASGWSWSVVFLDVDLDGYEDVLIGNGHEHDVLDADTQNRIGTLSFGDDWRQQRFLFPKLHLANVAYRNNGDLTFSRVEDGWGVGTEPDVSHGLATADLDLDGDLDLVINRLGAPAGVYRNESARPRIAVRLAGPPPNTQAIGAKIHVLGGPVPHQHEEVTLGGPYVSSSDPVHTFATGRAEEVTIVVAWRNGTWSVVAGARPNRIYEIHESGATPESPNALPMDSPNSPAAALFEDVTDELDHRHVEEDYDDFRRQPLLSQRWSQAGPGVTWTDLDRDGDEDLLIGTGRGGTLAVYRNDGGRLRRVAVRIPPAELDVTTILPLPDGASGTALLVGQMNYEAVSPSAARTAASVLRLEAAGAWEGRRLTPTVSTAVPGSASATGPLALADVDGDGDLDVFVGGRVLPARYPAAASSRLLRNESGRLVEDSAAAPGLAGLGLVSGAAFSDVDADGDPDLLLALEWGPVTLLINEGGTFRDATAAWGLADQRGLWNGVTTGDLNSDGLPDVIATNWGRNTHFQASAERPLEVYFADFDGNGTMDVVPAQFDPRVGDRVALPGLERMVEGIPYVARRFGSFAEYAEATLREVLGPPLAGATALRVTVLDHMVFLNRGRRFEAHRLPPEAQLAPAHHAGVADADGDGHEDVFITQNFYPTEPGTQRYEAGLGLWLRGDGSGMLTPMPVPTSGVMADGDQRGAALADFDADGRVDLVVAQNAGPTRLFHNIGASPGLRVRLAGPPGNPDGVGAHIRLEYPGGRGPTREIHAGAGYWSSDGPVQVMGRRGAPTAVWVRWSGGGETRVPIDPAQREVTVHWTP